MDPAGTGLLIEAVRDQRTQLARTIAAELTPAEQELLWCLKRTLGPDLDLEFKMHRKS